MDRKRTFGLAALAALLATTAAACGGSTSGSGGTSTSAVAGAQQTKVGAISGAGSSLVYPLLSNWAADYRKQSGVTVTYGPVGSGGGIQAITSRTVDFGASDR